jgi:hypothetical protein
MNKEYLIIFHRPEGFDFRWSDTVEGLNEDIDFCQKNNYKIMFAAKIAIIKEFI